MVRLLEASALRVACVPAVWKWVFHHVPPLVKLWSNHSKQPGSCWIHIIFVYLALSAAKQLSRSCILNHVNKFHEKWLRIYVTMTFKPHSHCLALSQVNNSYNSIYAEFASVHQEWSAVQNKALTSVGLTFAAVRASSWFSHGGTGMCLNCMFEVLTKYVYRFQTTFPRALPLLHHDTFELLRQLQGVKGLGTAVWLSKEMALAEIQKKWLGQALSQRFQRCSFLPSNVAILSTLVPHHATNQLQKNDVPGPSCHRANSCWNTDVLTRRAKLASDKCDYSQISHASTINFCFQAYRTCSLHKPLSGPLCSPIVSCTQWSTK